MRRNRKFIRQQISTKDVVGYWKMDNISSPATVFDYSLSGNNGALVGTDIEPAYPGILFNGTDDVIKTGNAFQSVFQAPFSVSLWMRPNDGHPPAEMDIVFGSKDGDGFTFQHKADGSIQVVYEADSISVVLPSLGIFFRDGVSPFWKHFAYTISEANGASLYADGALNKNVSAAAVTMANYVNTARVTIGARNTTAAPTETATNFITGRVADVVLFDAEKTASEIKSIFNVQRWRYSV